MRVPFADAAVEAAFEAADPLARQGMLHLRDLILRTADDLPEVGPVEEVLKWGQPAYVTAATKAGSTIRIGVPRQARFALFLQCQSRLIPEFQQTFPAWDRVEGSRAILFDAVKQIDSFRHGWLIRRALTYHQRRRAVAS